MTKIIKSLKNETKKKSLINKNPKVKLTLIKVNAKSRLNNILGRIKN